MHAFLTNAGLGSRAFDDLARRPAMISAARVLIYDHDPGSSFPLADQLDRRGYRTMRTRNLEQAREIAGAEHPDVIIFDAGATSESTELGVAVEEVWEPSGAPVMLVADNYEMNGAVSETLSALTCVLPRTFHDSQLFSRLASLVRLNTMREELARRADTAERYGVQQPREIAPPDAMAVTRILVSSADGDERKHLQAALGEGFEIVFVDTAFEAMDRLLAEEFEAFVLAARSGTVDEFEVCGDIRQNSRLYELPVVLIVDSETVSTPEENHVDLVDDVVCRPFSNADLKARIAALVRQRRYRRKMHSVYAETHHPMTSDALTGLFSHGFLHAHLGRQIEDAQRWAKTLSVGFFDIDNMAAINAEFGYVAGDRLLHQIGGIIGRLVRGEDLAARFRGDKFVVALPATAAEVAEMVVWRIVGVVGNTEFAVADGYGAVTAALKSAVTPFRPGDTAEALIARARAEARLA